MSREMNVHAHARRPRPSCLLGSLLLALGLSILDGCDETVAQKMVDASQTKQAPPAPQSPEKLDASVATYDRCYHECYTAHTNATNRETCKLECDSLAEDDLRARADPAAQALFQHLRGCMVGCWEDRKLSETNRETCLLTCDEDADIAGTPPPKAGLEVVPGTVLTPGTQVPPAVPAPVAANPGPK